MSGTFDAKNGSVPPSQVGSATLTLAVGNDMEAGTYPFNVTATVGGGNVSIALDLTITAAGAGGPGTGPPTAAPSANATATTDDNENASDKGTAEAKEGTGDADTAGFFAAAFVTLAVMVFAVGRRASGQ